MAFAAYWMRLKGDTPKNVPQTSRFQSQQVTPTSTSKVSTGKPAQHEEQVSSSAPRVSAEVDPFDALGDTLPSQPLAPKVPKFTGPEIRESNIKSEKLVLCGENENTLPPGYRWKDLEKNKPAGVPEKPQDVPKPVSTDEALDSLSAGFVSAAPSVPKKTEPKTELVGAVDAKSKGCSNFAPPPQQKQQSTTSSSCNKSPLPPADKKAKLEKPGENSSLSAGPSSTPAQPAKPKKDMPDSSIPLDALSALGDTLGAPEPPPKQPELKPGDIFDEKKLKSEKGVFVGEREDSLPPEYRFSEEELKKLPPPPKEPSLDTDEALDILSGGFTSPAAGPAVPAQVDEVSALDALTDEFVAPAKSAAKVSSAVPPGPKQKEETDEDAFNTLGDMLGSPEPPKKQPELKPGDIVPEKNVTSEKGVFVGEREDSLPPEYRFSEEELKKPPPLPKEPSLDTNEALDVLSGDFKSPSPPKISNCPPFKPPAKPSDDFALDALADEFVAPSSASKVQSAVTAPTHAERQLSEGSSSALDALSDTLAEIKPAPEPTPVPPKDVIKEKDIVEERVSKPGERDDSLPPDHRFSEADRKAFAEAKDVKPKQPSLDDTAALDLLSSDFSAAPAVKAHEGHTFTPDPTPPTQDSKAKKPSGDSSAVEQLSGQRSSTNVVPSSSTKGGKR